ncbi:MAG: hypothetical protein WBC21_01035 [Minisyncoccales bacterium]
MKNKKPSENDFKKEITMCQELCRKNNGKCNWGKCKDCGVIFLLYKLHKGKLIEDKNQIEKLRKKILKI